MHILEKICSATDFLELEVEPGTIWVDDDGDRWMVIDAVSITPKKGSGLVSLPGGKYKHALQMKFPIYSGRFSRLFHFINSAG